jgi:hypothetical protein
MSIEENVATQENAVLLLNSGDVDAFEDTLFLVDAIDHGPAPGQGRGRERYRTFLGRFESGQVVERWGSSDERGILTQIGAAPSGQESGVHTMKNLFSG